MWQQKLIHWLDKDEEEEEEDEDEELDLDWASDFLSPHLGLSQELLELEEPWAQVSAQGRAPVGGVGANSGPDDFLHPELGVLDQEKLQRRLQDGELPPPPLAPLRALALGRALWAPAQVPAFLRRPELVQKAVPHLHPGGSGDAREAGWWERAVQGQSLSWRSRQAYPEVGTVDGLASLFVDLLQEASWEDRVHILHALLRLLPDMSRDLCGRLHEVLLYLLNLDNPPSLQVRPSPAHVVPAAPGPGPAAPITLPACAQVRTQKQFVMLALQLLLACSLESHDVVLELMAYFLYSPASCR